MMKKNLFGPVFDRKHFSITLLEYTILKRTLYKELDKFRKF